MTAAQAPAPAPAPGPDQASDRASNLAPDLAPDLTGWITRLRTRGAARAEPVRWRQIEAMARRAQQHHGLPRQLIDQRLAELLAACEAALTSRPPPAPRSAPARRRSPLAVLHGQLQAAAHATAEAAADAAPGPAPGPGLPAGTAPLPELRALREHRATWARLDATRRLQRLALPVPDQAGPLNTQRLLQQALQLLHDTAPDYLNPLLQQLETLQWLEQGLLGEMAQRRPSRPRGERG